MAINQIEIDLPASSRAIRATGRTVNGWARFHNFKPGVVNQFFYGSYCAPGSDGYDRIVEALREDGFLVLKEPVQAA